VGRGYQPGLDGPTSRYLTYGEGNIKGEKKKGVPVSPLLLCQTKCSTQAAKVSPTNLYKKKQKKGGRYRGRGISFIILLHRVGGDAHFSADGSERKGKTHNGVPEIVAIENQQAQGKGGNDDLALQPCHPLLLSGAEPPFPARHREKEKKRSCLIATLSGPRGNVRQCYFHFLTIERTGLGKNLRPGPMVRCFSLVRIQHE